MLALKSKIAASPYSLRGVDKFSRALIALLERQMIATPEVCASKRAWRCHHIPASPPAGESVKGRQLPRKRIRLVERGRQCADQPHIFGDRSERGKNSQRIGTA